MRFKIISVGWQCAEWLEQTLHSVEDQSVDNWDVRVVYDVSEDDGAEKVRDWCDRRDDRWSYQVNLTQQFAVRNQVEALEALAPEPEDVVVWLDLDGDMLAHAKVLDHLMNYYNDGTLLTYGSYEPVPYVDTCTAATVFPDGVIGASSYRQHIQAGGSCCFNHLRTMKGRIATAIPQECFKWAERDDWYQGGTDYIFMLAGLELAGARHKLVHEVLLKYNHANPLSDNVTRGQESHACVVDFCKRPPLKQL